MSVRGAAPWAAAFADFNGDGLTDAAAVLPGANAVLVLIRGTTGQSTYPLAGQPQDVVAGDFNGDGIQDLAVALDATGEIAVLPGSRSGGFGGPIVSRAWGGPVSLVAVDLNGDGALDLAGRGGGANRTDGKVWTLVGVGDGTFVHPRSSQEGAWGVATGDLNADGVPDLVAVGRGRPGAAMVLIGRGDGTFLHVKRFEVPAGPTAVTTGDFDGDGRIDLAMADPGDVGRAGHVSFLFGKGDGTLGALREETAVLSPTTIAAGDFNGDGRDDVALSQTADTERPDVSIYLGSVDRDPHLDATFMPGFGGGALRIGDLDGNGTLDLLCAYSNVDGTSGGIAFAYGRGDGTFEAPPTFSSDLDSAARVAVADLNLDGVQDVVANGQQDASVMLGSDDGGLGPPVVYGPAKAVAVADVNVDGIPDLLFVAETSMAVLLGRGDGTFDEPASFPLRSRWGSIAVGDLNGDGHPDVVVASLDTDHVVVLLGKGDGTFGHPHRFATAFGPLTPVIADFDRDGNPDLAVGSWADDAVSILFGDGAGNFSSPVGVGVGDGLSSVAGVDLNADGAPDLVVNDADGVTVVLGRGDGTFAELRNYGGAGSVTPFVVADVDGDGHLDVTQADGDTASLLLFVGRGDGTLRPPVRYVGIGYGAGGIVVADLNHDGRLDFVIGNLYGFGAILTALQAP